MAVNKDKANSLHFYYTKELSKAARSDPLTNFPEFPVRVAVKSFHSFHAFLKPLTCPKMQILQQCPQLCRNDVCKIKIAHAHLYSLLSIACLSKYSGPGTDAWLLNPRRLFILMEN